MTGESATVLLWDIDGTLLTTARAGVFALEDALEEVAGARIDLQDKVLASGLTEHQVAEVVFEIAGVDPDPELTDRFLRAYERHLPRSLPLKAGRVLPGITEVLERLAKREDVTNILLTGNTPDGARAKLAHYGLLDFFEHGAYCVGPGPRADIARRAFELAQEQSTVPVDRERVFVIGDTPHDIEAGRAIGAQTVAIASGTTSRAELAEHGPSILFDEVVPDEFLQALGLGE